MTSTRATFTLLITNGDGERVRTDIPPAVTP